MRAQFDRVHVEGAGQPVEIGFGGKDRLQYAEAAQRAAHAVVGRDGPAFDAGVGDAIGPLDQGRAIADAGSRGMTIRPALVEQPRLDLEQPAVTRGVMANPDARGMAMVAREESLPAAVEKLDRAARMQGEKRPMDLPGHRHPTAERPTDAGISHQHLLLRQAKCGRDLRPIGMDPLGWRR